MSLTKKKPTRKGSIEMPSQKSDCCSHTPATFFLPLPTACPHNAFSTTQEGP